MSLKPLLVLFFLLVTFQISSNFKLIDLISFSEEKIGDAKDHSKVRQVDMRSDMRDESDEWGRQVQNQRDHHEASPKLAKRGFKQNEKESTRKMRNETENTQYKRSSDEVTSQSYKQTNLLNTVLNNQDKLKKEVSSLPQRTPSNPRNLQSTPCLIANCKQCTSYSSLNPTFALEANDLYPTNDHPLYVQEFCNVCEDGYFLYRHPLIADQFSLFIQSNYTHIDGLISVLSDALYQQESCVLNSQKIIQASIRINKLNIDSYLDQPDFFKTWLVDVMQKYEIKSENLNLVFAQQGSLILKYWFNVKVDFQPMGNVTNDVFNSQIQKIFQGSKVSDFDIEEIKSPDIPKMLPYQQETLPQTLDSSPHTQQKSQTSSQPQETTQQSKEQIPSEKPQELVDPDQNSGDDTEPKNIVLTPPQDNAVPSTPLSTSEASSPPNMIAIIVVGALSAILLSVATIYMLCIRKKKDQQEEENKQNQESKVKDEIKPTPIIVIRDGVSHSQNHKTKNLQNNEKETSILKNHKSNITQDNQESKQQTQSFLERIFSFFSTKTIAEVNSNGNTKPNLTSNQIQSMEDLVKSHNIETNKPLGSVPEFI